MISGIYFILNMIDGKYYVGSAINLYARWKMHKSFLNRNKHNNSYLQNAWNKYKNINFIFIIVELTEDRTKLYELEQIWFNKTNCCNRNFGYNIKPNAYNSSGYRHTEEAKKKISERNKALNIKPPSALGRKISEEIKVKMSNAMKGIKRKSTINMKKPKSEEHKKKLSEVRIGLKLSEETKLKIGQSSRSRSSWLCKEGRKCKCDACTNRKRLYGRDRYKIIGR